MNLPSSGMNQINQVGVILSFFQHLSLVSEPVSKDSEINHQPTRKRPSQDQETHIVSP